MVRLNYRLIRDPSHGYWRAVPVSAEPISDYVDRLYTTTYYTSLGENRAPDLARLNESGEEAEQERRWLRSTLYTDILALLEEYAAPDTRRLLDVGCGTGDFLAFMQENGWQVEGLDLSPHATRTAAARGLTVHCQKLGDFLKTAPDRLAAFTVVTLLNVLEHVPDPVDLLQLCAQVLAPGGIVVVRVPNDFSQLQTCASLRLGVGPWWITLPDHLNYFDFASLRSLLEYTGFEVIYAQGDFPMELFLLMGENYVNDRALGTTCHEKRCRFEMAIPGDLRRNIYRVLAQVGVGRNCLALGKKARG